MGEEVKTQNEGTSDEDIIKELCTCNGIIYENLLEEKDKIVYLEMFFSGFPKIIGLNNFSNLKVLCLVGQPINKIENLETLYHLTELWIIEAKLSKIENLDQNFKLKKLYLYCNEIETIENLKHLENLETLWLHKNHIKSLEGLQYLKSLKEINLAENRISSISQELSNLNYLVVLELSGNYIYNFKELTILCDVKSLREVGLCSPTFMPSPVGLLCNYTTHVLYHMPQLTTLDGVNIMNKSMELAEVTVERKKMFYNMKLQTHLRKLDKELNRMDHIKSQLVNGPNNSITALNYVKRAWDYVVDNKQNAKDNFYDENVIGIEVDILSNLDKLTDIDCHYLEVYNRLLYKTEELIDQERVELETGGNVRFEIGKKDNIWVQSVENLIQSRFCLNEYEQLQIKAAKVTKVTRIFNRILNQLYDDTLMKTTKKEVSPATSRKMTEYLFYIWDPVENPQGLIRLAENGIPSKNGIINLANCLWLADLKRIRHLTHNRKNFKDPCPYRFGQILLCKFWIGNNVQSTNNQTEIKQSNFPDADSVYQPKKECDNSVPVKITDNILNKNSTPRTNCECSNRQANWYAFESRLVVPEFLIDFEYETTLTNPTPFSGCTESSVNLRLNKVLLEHSNSEEKYDSEILKKLPNNFNDREDFPVINEQILHERFSQDLSTIVVLNLHASCLTSLKNIGSLINLKKLVLSFNHLKRLEDIQNISLEVLDVSFNKITSLDGLRKLPQLKTLDISWNKLCNSKNDIESLGLHCQNLQFLDLRFNRWRKTETVRARAISKLNNLIKINGTDVTEEEKIEAMKLATNCVINQTLISQYGRIDTEVPRSLRLESSAYLLFQYGCHLPNFGDQWIGLITSIYLDGQSIYKLSHIESLVNLKWASFNDNEIAKIEGLDNCLQLQELSLNKNCIVKLENLGHCKNLTKLELSHNYINSLDTIGLHNLEYLTLDNNELNSLNGLQKLTSLKHLYLGSNRIDCGRELFKLKDLSNLTVLDLMENPITELIDHYRLYVVYHLKSLKALDGRVVEVSEAMFAKDQFGGKLTLDLIVEKLGHSHFNELKELDVSNSCLKLVDLGHTKCFHNLRSINLEKNNLTTMAGLINLHNVKVLCLNYNKIESVLPKSWNTKDNIQETVLNSLEVLHLGYNGIKDLLVLGLYRIPSLRSVFLQGNEIIKIQGIENLCNIRELVLDRNRIKSLSENSLSGQYKLHQLHMEDNRLKELNYFGKLSSLQKLFLSNNKISDLAELDKLEGMSNLIEISLVNNPCAKRHLHRPALVYRVPSLKIIDGLYINDEERAKADLVFFDQTNSASNANVQNGPVMHNTYDATLPGIGSFKMHVPVKVTNMQLGSSSSWTGSGGAPLHVTTVNDSQDRKRVSYVQQNSKSGRNQITFIQQYDQNGKPKR